MVSMFSLIEQRGVVLMNAESFKQLELFIFKNTYLFLLIHLLYSLDFYSIIALLNLVSAIICILPLLPYSL